MVLSALLKPIQEYGEVQGDPLAHPHGPLGMIPQPDLGGGCVLHRVRVDEHRERAPPDCEPRHESPELRRRDQAHLEHGHRVRADRPVPECVNPEFWEFSPDALPERFGVFCLLGVVVIVYVYIKAPARSVVERLRELLICGAQLIGLEVRVALPVLGSLGREGRGVLVSRQRRVVRGLQQKWHGNIYLAGPGSINQ